MVLEKILESSLDSKEIKPVNPIGNQSWIFTGRMDAEAPILWPPDSNSQLFRKDPDAGKDWRQEGKGTTDKMLGWHHWLNGLEFEQIPADGEGQGSLVFCSPLGHKELDMTERLNDKFRTSSWMFKTNSHSQHFPKWNSFSFFFLQIKLFLLLGFLL